MASNQLILKKLSKIEKEVKEIREHMVDSDTILTEEERRLLDESLKHEKQGKLTRLIGSRKVKFPTLHFLLPPHP